MSDDIKVTVLKEILHPLYVEKIERWVMRHQDPKDAPVRMHNGYNHDNKYIGDIETTRTLCDKYGIKPEIKTPDSTVCSVGYSEKDNKWYGWSHRALIGFKIGDKLFEDTFGDDKTPYIEHGEKTIETLEQARESAIRFADSVANCELEARQAGQIIGKSELARNWAFAHMNYVIAKVTDNICDFY